MMVMNEPIDDQLAFGNLCNVLDRLEKKDGTMKRHVVLRAEDELGRLFKSMREKLRTRQAVQSSQPGSGEPDSLFGLLRLLVPQLDRARGPYGMKEKALGLLIINVLTVSKTASDARRLLNHRVPSQTAASADFAAAAYDFLRNRCPQQSDNKITIRVINDWLDCLARANADNDSNRQKQIMRQCLKYLTARQNMWLIRIILRDLKLKLSRHKIFAVFHANAKELYDACGDLEKVAITLADPSRKLEEIGLSLFSPFRPMLAERTSMATLVKDTKSVKRLFWEIKWDGERVQLHKSGNKYQYYSRNMFEYSSDYGSDPGSGSLTQFIHDCFLPSVGNCIIDGEMVCYHKDLDYIVQKGENFDVKKLKPGGTIQPCFVVFDVIMLNDELLTSKPLEHRYNVLFTETFTPKHGRIRFMNEEAKPRVVESKREVFEQLNKAIENNEEGIVLKAPDSTYIPGARSSGWYKLKAEYMDAMMDELDLIVLGGYYGEGRRTGRISQFLMGLAVPGQIGDAPKEFRSVARVGSGLSDEIRARLSDKLKAVRKVNPSKMIVHGNEKATVWFEPSESVILQVRASEIVPASQNTYAMPHTLRFPRITAWREDKAWADCMTVNEFEGMRTRNAGKLFTQQLPNYQSDKDTDEADDEESTPRPRKITRKRRAGATQTQRVVAKQFRSVDPSSVKKVSDAFSGKRFCIISGTNDRPKEALEKNVIEFGGICSQRAEEGKVFCVVAKDDSHPRLRTYTKNGLYDVVKADWLVASLKKGRLLPWRPLDMIATSLETQDRFKKDYDQYGDSYTRPATMESLKYSMERVRELGHQEPIDVDEIFALENHPKWAWSEGSNAGLFRGGTVAYFYINEDLPFFSPLARLKALFSFCGGQVAEKIHGGVSHVILDRRDADRILHFNALNRTRVLNKFRLIYCSWVEDCLEKHDRVPEELHAAILEERSL